MQELNARVLRYPGGTLGNYWDWRRGWFLRNYDLQNSVLLPADYNENPPATSGFDDRLEIFLDCIASSYAIPMWQWNVLSSDSKYQLATLYAAREKGIRKQYVELGNELYLAHTDNRNVYPNVDNYSEMAIDWASQIKNIPPFGNIKIAALGAENASIDEPGRRIFWLSNLLAKVGSNSDISAITLHQYERAKFSGAKDDISCVCDAALLPADFEFALSKGIIDAQEMVDDEVSQIANYGKEVWITEFNLFDKKHAIHGSWFHALYVSAMLMTYLKAENVTKIMPHTLVGDGIFSGIFSSNDGLSFGTTGGFQNPASCQCGPAGGVTDPWEFTALGNAMALVSAAGDGATSVSEMAFTGGPVLNGPAGNSIPGLQGWYFSKDIATGDFIIANFSGNPQTIDVTTMLADNGTPNNSNFSIKHQTLFASPGEFITGNAGNVQFPNDNEATITNFSPLASNNQMLLEPFSLTRIRVAPAVIPWTSISINNTTFCCHENLNVYARNLNWSEGYYWAVDGVPVENNDNPFYYEIPEQNETTGNTISLHNAGGDIVWNQDFTINRCSGSIVISSPSSVICPGDEVILNSSAPTNYPNYWNYHWTPTQPLENKDVNLHNTKAYPEHTTMFRQYSTDGTCWMRSNDLIINSGNPEPYFDKQELQVCNSTNPRDVKLTVIPANDLTTNLNYVWEDQNGVISQCTTDVCILSHTNQDWTITVTVTDNNSGCVGLAEIKVEGISCCVPGNNPPSSSLNITGANGLPIENDNISLNTAINNALNGSVITGVTYSANSSLIVDCNGSNTIKDIYVNRKLNVDIDATFIGCNFHIGEDASIILINDKDLELQGCSLTTCNPALTWRGIKVNEDDQFFASVPYTTTSSATRTYISNAETAVDISEKSSFVINGTDFNNNLYHLNLHDITSKIKLKAGGYAVGLNSYDVGRIYDCSFNSDPVTWPSAFSAKGCPNTISGISCAWVEGLTIGGENNGGVNRGNLFKNTAYGITLFRSGATIQGNTFEQIYYTTKVNERPRFPGSGILASYGDLLNGDVTTIGDPAGTTFGNNFLDVNNSIVINDGGGYSIAYNNFTGAATGKNLFDIRMQDILNGHIDIRENYFYSVQTGIYGLNIFTGSDLVIDHNHFIGKEMINFNSNFRHTAITLQNEQQQANKAVEVINNQIYDLRIGIHLNQTNNAYVYNNRVDFIMPSFTNPIDRHVGIYLEGGDNMNIIENKIYSDNFFTGRGSLLKGISVDLGVRNTFRCNEMFYLGYEMEINSACNPSTVENNLMDQFDVGVFYNGGNIGNQGAPNKAQDNVWKQPPVSSPSMKIDGSNMPTIDIWYHFGPTFNAANWFSPWPYDPSIITTDDNEPHNSIQCARAEEGDFDRFIASLNTDSANANPELNYIIAERVFRLLRSDSTLQTMTPLAYAQLTDLYNLYLNSTPDQLNEIERMLQDFHYEPASEMLPPVLDTNIVQEADKYIWSAICKLNLGDSLSAADSTQLFNLANSPSNEVGRASFSAGAIGFIERNPGVASAARILSKEKPTMKTTSIEPNPTHDCFWIRIPDENYTSYSLLSETGALLETIPVNDSSGSLFHCISPGTSSGTVYIIGKNRQGKNLDVNKLVILK